MRADCQRRFTVRGEARGVTVVDDYGHHPAEVRATLAGARRAFGRRLVVAFQPHRYTRLHDLFEEFCTCFNDADAVIVANVYPAGEAPIEGADRDHLVQALRDRGRAVFVRHATNAAIPMLSFIADSHWRLPLTTEEAAACVDVASWWSVQLAHRAEDELDVPREAVDDERVEERRDARAMDELEAALRVLDLGGGGRGHESQKEVEGIHEEVP